MTPPPTADAGAVGRVLADADGRHRARELLRGAARGGCASLAFSIGNDVCTGLLDGRAGRLASQNGGLRPGQSAARTHCGPGLARLAMGCCLLDVPRHIMFFHDRSLGS